MHCGNFMLMYVLFTRNFTVSTWHIVVEVGTLLSVVWFIADRFHCIRLRLLVGVKCFNFGLLSVHDIMQFL